MSRKKRFCICATSRSPVGSTVEGVLNFDRRFANMQIHSGEHILSGLILKELGLHNVGFHMGHENNTIDLDGEISAEQVRTLEGKGQCAHLPESSGLCQLPFC